MRSTGKRPAFALTLAAALAGLACGDDTVAVPVSVSVVVQPVTTDLAPGESRQFSATVTVIPEDGTVSREVRWEVMEGENYGVVSGNGVYTAPLVDPPVLAATVRARSVARPEVFGSAAVTLTGGGSTLDAGWRAFTAGDYTLARARFQSALSEEPGLFGARLGLAWTGLRTGDYTGAHGGFTDLLGEDANDADTRCGLILAAAALDLPSAVVAEGYKLIAASPAYVFAHDGSVSLSDVRWFTARAALDLGQYGMVVEQLDVLVPGHGLVASAAGFSEAALALLESIQNQV